MPDLTKLRYEPVTSKEESKPESLIDVVEEDRNWWKPYLLGLVTALCAVAFSFLLKDYFFEPKALSISLLQRGIFIVVSAAAFSSFFFIQSMLIKNLSRLHTIALMNTVALAAPFYNRISTQFAIIVFLVYLLLFLAAYMTWKELRLLVKIKFFRIGSRAFPKIITALALFVSMVFYINIQEGRTNVLSKDLLNDALFRPSESLISKVFPIFSFDKTGSEMIAEVTAQQIKNTPGVAALSQKKRDELMKIAARDLETRVESFMKTDVNFALPVREALYEWLVQNLIRGTESSKQITAISIAVLVFLILKGVGFVFSYAVLLVSFVLYEILLAMEFATIVLESKTREIVLLK